MANTTVFTRFPLRRIVLRALPLLGGLAALCLFWATRGNTALMDAWLAHVSMPVKRGISAVADLVPFSVCEAGATVLIVWQLVLLVRAIRRAVRGAGPGPLAHWAWQLAVWLVWGYAAVCALWGTQYYGTGFAQRAGLQAPPPEVAHLAAVTDYFAQQVNACADAVPRGEDGTMQAEPAPTFAAARGLYQPMAERWPFLQGPERRPKPAFYSKLMSAWGFTGYLCPLVGESTLNVDAPAVFLPVTVAHELAHQRGVATEQEANFVGILAATGGDAAYQYSGWLFGYLHLSNALWQADNTAARESYATLCEGAQRDLAANNAYWASWEGPVRETGETVYETFLQGYGQDLGLRSYGACVDLLVEWYLPRALAQ